MALGLAKYHQVTVATRANNRPVIERALAEYPGPIPRFLYIDPSSWVLKLKAIGILPVQLFYVFWQMAVARQLKRTECAFDIVHQLTFNSFEVPPFAFSGTKSIRVWGPVGGGQTVPSGLLRAFGPAAQVKEWLRNLRVKLSAKSPWVRRSLASCSLVLFANHETRKLLESGCHQMTGMMTDVGVDVKKFAVRANTQSSSHMVFLCVGNIEARKGVFPLLDAFRSLVESQPEAELRFVGDGPLLNTLRQKASKAGLGNQVVFTGKVGHGAIAHEFASADIFVFPSLRDTSGTVVLEAMATGLPVICFDHQGAALMVGKECGIKVRANDYTEAVSSLRDAMTSMIQNEEQRRDFGFKARASVESVHDWSSKVARIHAYYMELLNRSSHTKS